MRRTLRRDRRCRVTRGAGSGVWRVRCRATNLVTTFDVTAQEDVVILEERLVEDRLVSSDPAAGEYRFRGSFDEVRDLDIGETVVLGGAGFGIVRAVTEDGDETVLQLDEATLGDVIDTGTMEWDYDISWADFDFEYDESAALPGAGPVVADGEFGPQLLRALPQVSTIGYASGTPTGLRYADLQSQASKKTEVSFTHQGWKFDVELEPKDDRLNFKLVGSFGIGESAAKASISGEGWISGFNYSSVLEYEGGAPTNMSTEFNGLQGEMEIKWAAFRSPQEALKDIVKISAPLTLPIPIPGPFGIPMTIQMKIGRSDRARTVCDRLVEWRELEGQVLQRSRLQRRGRRWIAPRDPQVQFDRYLWRHGDRWTGTSRLCGWPRISALRTECGGSARIRLHNN